MLRLSGWTVGYVVANQIALFVVTVLANGTAGGPFIYISAYAFFQLPHGLFAVSLMTTFTPEMASAAARNDLARAARPAVARDPARRGGDRPRRRALHRPRPTDHRRAAPARRVLRRRRVGRRRHVGRVRGRAAALLDLPVRDARVLRPPRHVHAVLDQLRRERGEHRARVPAVRMARASRVSRSPSRSRTSRGRRSPSSCSTSVWAASTARRHGGHHRQGGRRRGRGRRA